MTDHARPRTTTNDQPRTHDHVRPRTHDRARPTAHDRARPRTTVHQHARPRTTAHDRPRLPYLFEEAVPTPGGFRGLNCLARLALARERTPSTTKIANKICKIIGILNKLKHILPQQILSTIYTSLITPHVNYGILLWGHEATRIYKLQKKAIWTISKSKYNAHTEPIFKKLQFLKLNDIFKLQQLKFYYKLIKGDLPKYFQHFSYIHNFEIHHHYTRETSTVEPLTNDHPHQRPSLSYDHISCDRQWFLFVYESLTSDHPSYTTTPMWGWSYKRGSTVVYLFPESIMLMHKNISGTIW